MKSLLLIALLITGQAYAQQKTVDVSAFEARMKGNNIEIKWSIKDGQESNYWEVQGSIDGIQYKALGLVMGPDPTNKNDFKFKEKKDRLGSLKYFRVLHIETNHSEVAGYAVTMVK